MAKITLQTLREYEGLVGQLCPGFKVAFKDESPFMKALDFVVRVFNPNFMRMTTTIGKTVYFPSRKVYEETVNLPLSFEVLFHESVHLQDEQNNPWSFKASYLFPQLLALLPALAFIVLGWPHSWLLVLFVAGLVPCSLTHGKPWLAWPLLILPALVASVLAVALTGWASLLLVATIVLLCPWPSSGRVKWELNAYTASLAFEAWTSGEVSELSLRNIRGHFVGPAYYFMSWSSAGVTASLEDAVRGAGSGRLQGLPSYQPTYDFLYRHDLLHSGSKHAERKSSF